MIIYMSIGLDSNVFNSNAFFQHLLHYTKLFEEKLTSKINVII